MTCRNGTRLLSVALAVASAWAAPAEGQLRAEHFGPMKARSIGPAGMSGRVAAVAVAPTDGNLIFVGAATGGVWRSRDGGITWQPVFDGQRLLGVGSVAVFAGNPDLVWVGTGEGNPRNSAGVGDGVYRSLDGGETWARVGLDRSERVHRIVLHPTDPDVAWVAAMGPAWSDGGDRGVYRTTDGGRTWTRVLYANERTGAADLVMDPANPNRLFAAMWEYRRSPWFFESGGPGSGLHVTEDGGDTWRRLTSEDGLPAGELGRMGIAVSRSSPGVVYALVEARRSALLRSDDSGRSWRTISDRPNVAPRPFYYADIRVDPSNENRLYSLHSQIQVSEDGGRTFRTVVPSSIIHGDVHELWIDPADSRRMIIGEDGGIAFTYDRGRAWRFVENLPLAQFYHVNVDMEVPFNVYGGLQDNGSWYGPSDVWGGRGVMNGHWRRVGGGDGFAVINDFSDPRYGYSLSQQGNLLRFDKLTGNRKSIRPLHPEGVPLRFHWNAALNVDPFDSTTIYLGSQFVHRSRDHGASWEIISPDLTTNDPAKQRQDRSGGLTLDATGAENHTTILSIAPSPLERGVIWVGTDDGNLQITRDGGATWSNVGDRVPGVPRATWIPHVEPSRHDPAVAYVVYDDHRRGSWTPYVYRTGDYGRTWTSLATPEIDGFVHVIEEDPGHPDLLFLGTEFGLWVSVDRGRSWTSWQHGMPPAPVRALMVHPRDHDLVIGTHGRAVWVLDDVRPLRAIAADPALVGRSLAVLPVAPARQHIEAEEIGAVGYRSVGHAMFIGEKRPYGALVHYWRSAGGASGPARIEIRSEDGETVRTLDGPADEGINRVVWDLRGQPLLAGGFGGQGPEVLPGTYRVTVHVGDEEASGELEVLPDPRIEADPVARRAKIAALREVAGWIGVAREARSRLETAVDRLDGILGALGGDSGDRELTDAGRALREELSGARERLFTGPECQGICGGETVYDRVQRALGPLSSSLDAPTPGERIYMDQARSAAREIVEAVNALFAGPVAAYRDRLQAAGFTPLPAPEPLRLPGGP